ncbi:MAG: AzlD domain-containing protein [Coriobacteriia bacterium]|nr:AzlD domain-containing protein [Coriobacteriia bacterium]
MINTVPQHTIIAVIIGMGLVNFGLRFIPMAALSRVALPKPIMRWLSFVPISVMGALFAKEVLLPSANYSPMAANPGIYGALASMLVFKLSKSFIGSTLAGVGFYLILRWVFTLMGFGV